MGSTSTTSTESRRNRGEGSVTLFKKKGLNGAEHDLWMGRVTIAPGVRRSVYGRTKSETIQKMRAALAKADQGVPQGDSRTTVATFLTEWLEGPATRSVRPSTLAAYRHYVTRHLIPGLGRHRLVNLRPEHIDALLAALGSGPEALSPRTLQQVRAILRSADDRAPAASGKGHGIERRVVLQ